MSNYRILMVTSQFVPDVFGGAEQQCQRLAARLSANGHEVTILTSTQSSSEIESREEAGYGVIALPTRSPPQLMGRHLLSTFEWVRAARHWISSNAASFDLIHCHQAKLNAWVGTGMGRALAIPTIVKVGNAGDRMDLLRLTKRKFFYGTKVARDIVRHTDLFVAISTAMVDDLTRFGVEGENIELIPNGIDLPPGFQTDLANNRQHIRSQLSISDNQPLLLFTGRLERQKDVSTLLKAFARSQAVQCNARLVIAGDGVERDTLNALAAQLDISNQVSFLGRIDDIWPYYAAADGFVLPALAEGLSNSLLEAMAAGLPVIGSKVSGTEDQVKEGENGFLFTPGNDLELSAKIDQWLGLDPQQRSNMGRAGQLHVQSELSMAQIAARYEDVYRRLLSSEPPT